MNIVFLNDIPVLGGGELWVLKMVRALRKLGHQASVVCPWRSQLFQACLDSYIDVHGMPITRGTPFHEPLYHFLKSREVDVVYATVLGRICEAQVLGELVRRLDRKALVILKTGLPPMTSLDAEYYGYGAGPEVRRLHVVSEENRQRFFDWQGPSDFVRVLREGVDLSRFHPGAGDRIAARRELGWENGELVVACASRLHPAKGQDNLLLAAHEVAKKRPELRLVIAGSGEDKGRLERLRDHLGLQTAVRFTGHLDDVRPVLAAADVYCHPSLADGMPNSLAEAMAMGLPAVASRVGGIPEILRHEENGLLVTAHDNRELEAGLLRMLDEAPLRARLGAHASETIRIDLDFEARLAAWVAEVQSEVNDMRPLAPPAVRQKESAYPVLFLMSLLRTGGEETELAILARHLHRSTFPVSVASAWPANEPSPAGERLRQYGVLVDTGCHTLASLEEKADYLAAKIRAEKIRVVVACQDTQLARMVFDRLDPSECKLVEHAGIAGEVHRIPKDRTALLIGVSAAIAREAAALFADPSRARYLPSMVDTSEYNDSQRGDLRKAYGFHSDPIVLFAGRLDAKKGVDHLVEAAKVLCPEFPQVRFLIVGPPDAFQAEYGRALMERAARELPKDRFIFAGARKDVPQIMTAADIFVLPSRGEGMSHVINEAGAAGLPVIAFDDGAAREQLDGGAAGVLVRPGDTGGLIEALRLLLGNPDLRSRLGAALRQKVYREYSAQQVVPQWRALLAEVCAGTEAVPRAPAIRTVPSDRDLEFPAEIQIETNTACNATCIMCPYPEVSKELPAGRMDLDLYQKILAECAADRTLWRIEPFLNNEPFTDTRMVDWIAMAKKMVPHAMVTVTSNGSLLLPKVTDRLIHSGLDGIWFSFNGSTRETYEHIMGLSFDLVKKNIDYLLDVKPASLRVFTNMIETTPMKGEIAENIRYWQSRGVQSGSSPLVNRAGNVKNFDDLNYKPLSAKPVRVCELLYHKMYVGWNGDVLLCCMDWRRKVVLGNLRQQTIREVWNGEKYRRFRRLQEQQRVSELELCNACTYVHA
ncbi:MAG: glycosyltransferase [Bryobacteraceae bacterium]|nr:glycosyltransferase [Bryobacteraceae bacterium]